MGRILTLCIAFPGVMVGWAVWVLVGNALVVAQLRAEPTPPIVVVTKAHAQVDVERIHRQEWRENKKARRVTSGPRLIPRRPRVS
jgi:hypothetical protein